MNIHNQTTQKKTVIYWECKNVSLLHWYCNWGCGQKNLSVWELRLAEIKLIISYKTGDSQSWSSITFLYLQVEHESQIIYFRKYKQRRMLVHWAEYLLQCCSMIDDDTLKRVLVTWRQTTGFSPGFQPVAGLTVPATPLAHSKCRIEPCSWQHSYSLGSRQSSLLLPSRGLCMLDRRAAAEARMDHLYCRAYIGCRPIMQILGVSYTTDI